MSDRTIPDQIIKHNAHRELVFEGYASEKENLSLMIRDESVDGIDEGYYKIPLYTAQPQETVNREADIELVHIFPLLFDSQAQDDNYTSVPTSGYIYIYVDGYLWRELQVEPLGDVSCVFRDVNLAFQKGYLPWKTNRNNEYKTQGRRDSTGERLKTIIVPNKLKGQQTCVEIAYSEVQWSWTQILKLGGINPEDPRLNVKPPLSAKQSQSPDASKAQAARAARMQVIDNLSDFENSFSQTGLIKQNETTHKKLPHPDSEDIAKVVLNNGLFFVRQHINKIHQLQIEIDLLLMEVKGEDLGTKNSKVIIDPQKFARFELAEKMINRLYQMNDAILDGDIIVTGDKNANKLQKEQMEYAEKVKGWRSSCLNEDTLKSELQYDILLETAEKIKNEQLALVQLIDNDVELVSFKSCMKDFTLHPNATFADGLDVIKEISLALKIHPAHQFSTIILDKNDWENLSTDITTSSCLLKLFGEHPSENPHPVSDLFFPKPKIPKTETEAASLEIDPKDHKDPFNPKFSLERYLQVERDESDKYLNWEMYEQVGRRLSQALMGVATGLLDLSLLASAQQGGQQTTKQLHAQLQTKQKNTQANKLKIEQEIKQKEIERNNKYKELKQAQLSHKHKLANLQIGEAEYERQNQLAKEKIAKLKGELSSIDSFMAKAKRSLLSMDNTLAKVAAEISQGGSVVLSRNKGLMAVIRMINEFEKGQFTALEMAAEDYHNGKFGDGFIELNSRSRAEIAKELVEEIRHIVRAANNSRIGLLTPDGKVFDNIKDIIHLRSKVKQFLELISQTDDRLSGEAASGLKMQVIALVKSEDMQKLRVESVQNEIETLRSGQLKLGEDKLTNKIQGEKLADLLEASEKTAKTPFLSNMKVDTFAKVNMGVMGAVGIFELLNITRALEAYESGNSRAKVNLVGGVIDFVAIITTLTRESYVMKTGQPSETQLTLLKRGDINLPKNVKTWENLTKTMHITNIIASIYSAVTSFIDGYNAIRRGDNDAAFGLMTMGVGFASMATGDAIALRLIVRFTPWAARAGWIGLIIVLIGAIIYYWCLDEEIESWLKQSPWGTDAYNGFDEGESVWFFEDGASYSWRERPDYAYQDFAHIIMRPQIHADNKEKINDFRLTGPTMAYAAPTTYTDTTEGYLILTCPTNTHHNYFDVTLEVKDRSGDDSEYMDIMLGQAGNRDVQWLEQFWQSVMVKQVSGGNGIRIDINQYNCLPLFKRLKTRNLTFRLRARSYPHGKFMPISKAFPTITGDDTHNGEFTLPVIGERLPDGSFKKQDPWAEVTLNINLYDYLYRQEVLGQ